MLPEEIAEDFQHRNLPSFRAKQVSEWLAKGASSFQEMANLPKTLRDELQTEYELYRPSILRRQISAEEFEQKAEKALRQLTFLQNGEPQEPETLRAAMQTLRWSEADAAALQAGLETARAEQQAHRRARAYCHPSPSASPAPKCRLQHREYQP